MSGTIFTEFYCDQCQCGYNHLPGHSIRIIRREAKDDGWIYKDRKDICPACQKEEAQSEGGEEIG